MAAGTADSMTAFLFREAECFSAVRASPVNVGLAVGKFPLLQIEETSCLADDPEKPFILSAPVIDLA